MKETLGLQRNEHHTRSTLGSSWINVDIWIWMPSIPSPSLAPSFTKGMQMKCFGTRADSRAADLGLHPDMAISALSSLDCRAHHSWRWRGAESHGWACWKSWQGRRGGCKFEVSSRASSVPKSWHVFFHLSQAMCWFVLILSLQLPQALASSSCAGKLPFASHALRNARCGRLWMFQHCMGNHAAELYPSLNMSQTKQQAPVRIPPTPMPPPTSTSRCNFTDFAELMFFLRTIPFWNGMSWLMGLYLMVI